MNLKLTIEGSASQLAMILANLPDGVAVGAASPAPPMPAPVAQLAAAPVPMPVIPPMPTAPTGGDGDDDDGPVAAVADGAVDANGLPWDERIHAKTKATNADGSWRYRRGVDDATKAAVEAELRSRSAPAMPAPVAQPAPVPMPVIPPMPANPEGVVAPAIPTAPVAMPAVPMQPMAPPPPLAAAPIPPAMPAPADMAHGAVAAAPVASPPPMPAPVAQPASAPAMPTPEAVTAAVSAASGTLDFAQFMQHLSGQMTKRDGAGAPLVHADYLAGITKEISDAWAPHGHPALTAITDIASDPQKISYAMQLMQRDGRW